MEDSGGEKKTTPHVVDHRLIELFLLLAKYKRFISQMTGAGLLMGIAIISFLPRQYEAVTLVLPARQHQSLTSTILTQFEPLALLSQLAGTGFDIRNPSALNVAILRSRTVSDALINQFSLMDVYGEKTRAGARTQLARCSEIAYSRQGLISVAVRDSDPDRAASLANGYITELERINRNVAVSQAKRRRTFFEQELENANHELAEAEVALERTQERTGMLDLDNQTKIILNGYMRLKAQVEAKETQIQSMEIVATATNPNFIRASQELSALREELRWTAERHSLNSPVDLSLMNIPNIWLEYFRRLREVKYREFLVEILAKEYETAHIDESKDSIIVRLLDKAVKPEIEVRNLSGLSQITMIMTIFGFLAGVVAAFVRESLKSLYQNPQYLLPA